MATAKGSRSASTTAAPEQQLHPRVREQSLGSDRSPFPDDFHALYDRGFRASRGITPVTARHAQAGSSLLTDDVAGVNVQYDDATQLPNLVITTQPAARLSRRSTGTAEGAVTQFIKQMRSLESLTGGC